MIINIFGLHHDPIIWGDDVETFCPDRFRFVSYGGKLLKVFLCLLNVYLILVP